MVKVNVTQGSGYSVVESELLILIWQYLSIHVAKQQKMATNQMNINWYI